jgi:adenylate cyclase
MSDQPPHELRKLAAIVAIDVVGFSRLMGADEAGTLARLKAHRSNYLNRPSHGNGGPKTTAARSPYW